MIEYLTQLPPLARVALILALAVAAHLLVRAIQTGTEAMLRPAGGDQRSLIQRYPKVVTILTLIVSAATFAIYFAGIGLVLSELGVPLGTYFASATIIALAVGFGSQGLVQDVVSGLTLIFSDVITVGDVVDVSGQVGRVERVGLRFTIITNVFGQRVSVPNRNIGLIGRFRGGGVRAFVDVQIPAEAEPTEVEQKVLALARGLHAQHSSLVGQPESLGVRSTGDGNWQFVRIRFRLWPGQQPLIENAFRQRVIAAMRALDSAYADWMVAVTYRAADK